ncbi:MAG: MerR family transcriptional regulator [Acidobacteriota bacterium]
MAKKKKQLFYKIGEACKQVDIQPYVLRYWETEFPFLKPDKSKSGQRVYSERELEIVRRIKELLYEEGYTIAGAKKKLEGELEEDGEGRAHLAAPPAAPAAEAPSEELQTELDSAREKVKTLRSGIEEALGQARELLTRIDPKST